VRWAGLCVSVAAGRLLQSFAQIECYRGALADWRRRSPREEKNSANKIDGQAGRRSLSVAFNGQTRPLLLLFAAAKAQQSGSAQQAPLMSLMSSEWPAGRPPAD
jgi:predicted dithiol-disulfide oxidoreductase (DUF899 family)